MNGGHDLGGMHGFGPIDPEPQESEPVFHSPWERRAFGLSLAVGALGKWNLDMMRHAGERQHPVDYLRHAYYENWLSALEKLLVERGLVTAEELAGGTASEPADEETRRRVLKPENVQAYLARGPRKPGESDTPPRFQPGQRVRGVNRHPTGHTRQPRYVRGRVGVVHRHHGVRVFPDRNAEGKREEHHLYSVRFEASELWGEDRTGTGAVYVDLWQDYLEPA